MDGTLEVGLSVLSTGVTSVIGYLMYRIKKHEDIKEREESRRIKQHKQEADALRASLLALTRDRILQGYRYYRRESGISTQDLETMGKLYAAYHALGGNGTITAVYSKITAFPIKEE